MAVNKDKLGVFAGKFGGNLGTAVLSGLLPHQRVIAAIVFACVLLAPSRAYSERPLNHDDRVELELSA